MSQWLGIGMGLWERGHMARVSFYRFHAFRLSASTNNGSRIKCNCHWRQRQRCNVMYL